MKYILLNIIIFSIALTGCVTLPKPIDEVYLSEKTEEQNAKLDKLSIDIIAKKKEKDKIEKDMEIALQKIEASRTEAAQVEAAGEALLEKEKLYTMEKDSRLEDVQKEQEQNRKKDAQIKALLAFNNAKADKTEALLNIKKSELAVFVAELDYEKALIAKAYQLKREEYKNNVIDDNRYKKFLEDQKAKLESNKKNYEKASQILSEAESNLSKSGYEGEK